MKLYHAQMESFTCPIDQCVVAETEEQARELVYRGFGRHNGFLKKHIGVYEVEVEGYDIQVIKRETGDEP